MFLNKKLLTIIGAAGMAFGVSACSSSGSGLYGACTLTTIDDGSEACGGVTATDYGDVTIPDLPAEVTTPEEACIASATDGVTTATWSDHCSTQWVCSVDVTSSGVTVTTESGASLPTAATAGEIKTEICDAALACAAETGTPSFTSNVAAVQTTDGTDGDCGA